jgi:hypothetical protein
MCAGSAGPPAGIVTSAQTFLAATDTLKAPRPLGAPTTTGHAMTASFSHTRASDRDRDLATGVLQTAYAEGRLTKDEYDARLGHVFSAQVFAQLDAATAGLVAPAQRPAARPGRTNSLAIASLICGAAQVIAGPITTIPAIAFGHVARRQIRRTGEDGSGLAIWGLALGYAGLALAVVAVVAIILIFFSVGHHIQQQVPLPVPNFSPPGG